MQYITFDCSVLHVTPEFDFIIQLYVFANYVSYDMNI